MLFSSSVFLFLFLPIVLILYFNPIVKNRTYRNIILLVASLFFYAWGEPVFVLLMVASIVVNWLIGLAMAGSGRKKTWLVLSVVWNLSLMFVFKYLTFVLSNVELLLHRNIADIEISLPLGISFFTFQILSYIFDLYYGNTKVQKNCYKFALYVSMFPQLVAGPIVRYEQIAYEIDHRQENMEDFSLGMTRFVYGLGKKVLLSNYMGTIADNMFYLSGNSNLSAASAWLGGIAYTLQIYYDFSGYSDMAIGLGRMFGFHFLENFNYPYVSKSITEFWRRWHISLSSWFREYVYIPLGGNHVTISRNIVNLLIVWMLTGMWHGAAWNFIVWGIYYGVVLVLEKYVWGAIVDRWPSVLQHIYALVLVLVGWVFFFSPSLGAALRYLFAMVGGGAGFASKEVFFVILTHWLFYLLAVIGSTTLGSRMLRAILNVSENHTVRTVITLVVFFGMLVISVAYLIADTYNPFLYFRF
mgnify:CR=1 FL=1